MSFRRIFLGSSILWWFRKIKWKCWTQLLACNWYKYTIYCEWKSMWRCTIICRIHWTHRSRSNLDWIQLHSIFKWRIWSPCNWFVLQLSYTLWYILQTGLPNIPEGCQNPTPSESNDTFCGLPSNFSSIMYIIKHNVRFNIWRMWWWRR